MVRPSSESSVKEQVLERLRIDVLCGRLREGEPLNEVRLVNETGLSRTLIREILQRLANEGLLESRPNVAVKVAPQPADGVRELVVPIRRNLELFALKSCFHGLTDEDFRQWDKILEKLKAACEAKDYVSIAEHDIEFHRSIIRRAEQPDLNAIWMALVARVRCHFWQTHCQNYCSPLEIYKEHRQIVETFRTGDLNKSLSVLAANIQ